MALTYGTKSTTTVDGEEQVSINRQGMTQAIYAEMDTLLSPPLQQMVDDAESEDDKAKAEDILAEARHSWEKLAFAFAKGVVDHLVDHMEIQGIESTIDDNDLEVDGSTGSTNSHQHTVNTPVTGSLTMQQSDDGTGHVS